MYIVKMKKEQVIVLRTPNGEIKVQYQGISEKFGGAKIGIEAPAAVVIERPECKKGVK